MLDPRERRRADRPVEVRVETCAAVDDFVVLFADGSRRYFQVKTSLEARGDAWKAFWLALDRQLRRDLPHQDRVSLVLGEPSPLGTNLREIASRSTGADADEWHGRLNGEQRSLVSSIARLLGCETAGVLQLAARLDVDIWPAGELERDYAPNWMPPCSSSTLSLFGYLTGVAWEGATTRSRLEASTLYDRLRQESLIVIADPPNWGAENYRSAVAALSVIEVLGTPFRRPADAKLVSTNNGHAGDVAWRSRTMRRPAAAATAASGI